jgi:FHS family L-fucose permease-like MFS transporter
LSNLWVKQFREQQMAEHPEYANMLPSVVDGKITEALHRFREMNPEQHLQNQTTDLAIIRNPYVVIGIVVSIVFVVFLVAKMPDSMSRNAIHPIETAKRLLKCQRWREGVIAQTFYVAAQICCWTYIIHYAMTNLGMSIDTAQNYNIVAMVIFLTSRFICTFLLKYISSGHLLMSLACGGMVLTLGTIFLQNMLGLYCLIGISACMSLMFPTIYGIALRGLGDDAKLGSAGLVFGIVGGAIMPMGVGWIIDQGDFNLGFMTLTSVSASFVLPLSSFIVIAIYGYRTFRIHQAPCA